MDETDVRTMLRGLADTVDGSARIDLPLAAQQGRRSRRWRQMRISGSLLAMGAAIGLIAAVLVVPGHRPVGVAPAVPAPAAPARSLAPDAINGTGWENTAGSCTHTPVSVTGQIDFARAARGPKTSGIVERGASVSIGPGAIAVMVMFMPPISATRWR